MVEWKRVSALGESVDQFGQERIRYLDIYVPVEKPADDQERDDGFGRKSGLQWSNMRWSGSKDITRGGMCPTERWPLSESLDSTMYT
jgi:hypothetical protein